MCSSSKRIAGTILLALLALNGAAQEAICGVVEAIDLPIDGIVMTYDDFGLYRNRFGGRHTGLDIGFGRWGDPVRAAARGRITYSDPLGWDTEKGVIIIEHTFPDGSIYYSLYGHVEQSDTVFFPNVGDCVERGKVLAGIGYPSRGAPHLHYEIRNFMPNDGGPGYVPNNPLDDGWLHPLDFTLLWRARLNPAFTGYASFDLTPALPPVLLDSGVVAIANGSIVQGVLPPEEILWRVETEGVINGLAALPGGRVVARSRDGQVVVLQGGNYAALWRVPGRDVPFVMLEGALIFVTDDGGLAAYDSAGSLLWMLPGNANSRVMQFESSGRTLIYIVREDSGAIVARLIDATGSIAYETRFSLPPYIAPTPEGGWAALDGGRLLILDETGTRELGETGVQNPRNARLTLDTEHNFYLYLGESENLLLSYDSAGVLRWRIPYPYPSASPPPLLHTPTSCALFTLDSDGMVNVFRSTDGALLNQIQLYAGGQQSSSPRGRLLRSGGAGEIIVGSGFLTLVSFRSAALTGETCSG